MVVSANPSDDYAQITLVYKVRENKGPAFSYYTGRNEGQRADPQTFELFQHYYLSALRDSTRDLLRARSNILGGLIQRTISRNDSSDRFEGIVAGANRNLLQQQEVIDARDSVNINLGGIFKQYTDNQIGLQIEQARLDFIVNLIKPFLPFNRDTLEGSGMSLPQNSLGFNNLIYIATVLGDISQRVEEGELAHFALLIEEPEAHLHPQLQLSLYNFLKSTNTPENCQLFITTHSPTLTSKVPLDNLILLDGNAYHISNCFEDRATESIVQDSRTGKALSDQDFQTKKKQLERYIDVTRSQLFYAKGVLLVEGISEELLIPSFCRACGYRLEDYRLELVNVRGISFYPFLALFNSSDESKRLPKPVAVITDDDRFTDSKKSDYSFDKLCENDYKVLDGLYNSIFTGEVCSRGANLQSFANERAGIAVMLAYKTLEYEMAFHNVAIDKTDIEANAFVDYIKETATDDFDKVRRYYQSLPDATLSDEQRGKVAILLWKLISSKAGFAQDFAIRLIEKVEQAEQANTQVRFTVPPYIVQALNHITTLGT